MSLNTYLIPSFFVTSACASCKNQNQRAQGSGDLINTGAPDIVALQEVWGAGTGYLERDGYCPLPRCRSWYGLTVLDTMWQYANARGGLWVAHKTSTTKLLAVRWWTFSKSNTKSRKGIVMATFDAGGGKLLVIVNTHLDPTNDNGTQDLQCTEIASFITNEVPLGCGVVLVGDFNFEPSSSQYRRLMDGSLGLGVRDSCEGCHEPTYDALTNSLVCFGESKRIDYQFFVDGTATDKHKFATLETVTPPKILRQERGSELSDHWGLLLSLRFA
jgi:endonuclease/exonuclease/phosphatase family metal-dependent hydrolase